MFRGLQRLILVVTGRGRRLPVGAQVGVSYTDMLVVVVLGYPSLGLRGRGRGGTVPVSVSPAPPSLWSKGGHRSPPTRGTLLSEVPGTGTDLPRVARLRSTGRVGVAGRDSGLSFAQTPRPQTHVSLRSSGVAPSVKFPLKSVGRRTLSLTFLQ